MQNMINSIHAIELMDSSYRDLFCINFDKPPTYIKSFNLVNNLLMFIAFLFLYHWWENWWLDESTNLIHIS
jgi:hypothetical protein